MDDLISRAAVLEELSDLYWTEERFLTFKDVDSVFDRIKALPTAQPEKRTEDRTETRAYDCISREAAIDDLRGKDPSQIWDTADIEVWVNALPSAQPEPCKDTVSRSRVKLLLARLRDAVDDGYGFNYQSAVDDLRDMPSAQPTDTDIQRMQDIEQVMLDKAYECGKQDAAQWIPCSERLPEHGGWYIVTRRITKDNDRCVGLLWYSTTHGWKWDNAIAWMPLPEPWREVSK